MPGLINNTTIAYSPNLVTVFANSRIISGFGGQDPVIGVERTNEEEFAPTIGFQGDGSFSENPDKSGKFNFMFLASSPSVAYFESLLAAKMVFAVRIVGKFGYNELAFASHCMVNSIPRVEYNKVAQDNYPERKVVVSAITIEELREYS